MTSIAKGLKGITISGWKLQKSSRRRSDESLDSIRLSLDFDDDDVR
jgi:hypothetical protein